MIGRKKAENDVDHRGSGQNTETYRRESLYFSFSLAVLLFSRKLPPIWSTLIYISCDELLSFANFSENEQHQIASDLQS